MTYNNPTPSQSTTLTASERSREARRLLEMLREEDKNNNAIQGRLTNNALGFVQARWLEMDLGGQINVTENQLLFLRDIWAKFA